MTGELRTLSPGERPDVTVVILTFNEEANLPYALDSVCGWARQVIVLDSFSTDRSVEIARERGCEVFQNAFEDYSRQRNHALQLPIRGEWVLFLDADEWVPAVLADEITALVASRPAENGFFIAYRLIFMGRWIKRGYYPTWILRLFRHGMAHCEARGVGEHLRVEGGMGRLRSDFIHEDRKGVGSWVDDHNRYAEREALEILRLEREGEQGEIDARFWGTQAQRKRWLRNRVWRRMPPLLRPFLYFGMRYVGQGGFLDGREGFTFHFLQALWYHLLIDVKYLDFKRQAALRGTAGPGALPGAARRDAPGVLAER